MVCIYLFYYYLPSIYTSYSVICPQIIHARLTHIRVWGIIQAYKIRDFSRDITTRNIDFFDTLFTKNKKMRHSYL